MRASMSSGLPTLPCRRERMAQRLVCPLWWAFPVRRQALRAVVRRCCTYGPYLTRRRWSVAGRDSHCVCVRRLRHGGAFLSERAMVSTRRGDYGHDGCARSRSASVDAAERLWAPLMEPQRLGQTRRMRTHPDVSHYFRGARAVGPAVSQQECQEDGVPADAVPGLSSDEIAVQAMTPAPLPPAVTADAAAVCAESRHAQDVANAVQPPRGPTGPVTTARRPRKNPYPRYVPPGSRSGAPAGSASGSSRQGWPPLTRHGHASCGCRGMPCRPKCTPVSPRRQYVMPVNDDTPPSENLSPAPDDAPPPAQSPLPPPAFIAAVDGRVQEPIQPRAGHVRGGVPCTAPTLEVAGEHHREHTLDLVVCDMDPIWPGAVVWTVSSSAGQARAFPTHPSQADAPFGMGVPRAAPEAAADNVGVDATQGDTTAPGGTANDSSSFSAPCADADQVARTSLAVVRSVTVSTGTLAVNPSSFQAPRDRPTQAAHRTQGTDSGADPPRGVHHHPGRFVAYYRPLLAQAREAAHQADGRGGADVVSICAAHPAPGAASHDTAAVHMTAHVPRGAAMANPPNIDRVDATAEAEAVNSCVGLTRHLTHGLSGASARAQAGSVRGDAGIGVAAWTSITPSVDRVAVRSRTGGDNAGDTGAVHLGRSTPVGTAAPRGGSGPEGVGRPNWSVGGSRAGGAGSGQPSGHDDNELENDADGSGVSAGEGAR